MRIQIETKGRVTDRDIRALYIINKGLNDSSSRMRLFNLQYFADREGYILVKKKALQRFTACE